MASAQPSLQRQSSLTAIGISLAVHAVLIGAWQLARPLKLRDDIEPRRTQFLRLLPAPAPAPERQDKLPPSSARAAAPRTAAPAAALPQPEVAAPAESMPATIALPALALSRRRAERDVLRDL